MLGAPKVVSGNSLDTAYIRLRLVDLNFECQAADALGDNV